MDWCKGVSFRPERFVNFGISHGGDAHWWATERRNETAFRRVLEDANVKLGNVLSDVFGASGQAMLEALLENRQNPSELPRKHGDFREA